MSANGPDIAYDFSGRTVIHTGSSNGIGRTTVEMFLAAGARVVAVDLSTAALEELRDASDGRLVLVEGDVSDPGCQHSLCFSSIS